MRCSQLSVTPAAGCNHALFQHLQVPTNVPHTYNTHGGTQEENTQDQDDGTADGSGDDDGTASAGADDGGGTDDTIDIEE